MSSLVKPSTSHESVVAKYPHLFHDSRNIAASFNLSQLLYKGEYPAGIVDHDSPYLLPGHALGKHNRYNIAQDVSISPTTIGAALCFGPYIMRN